MTDFIHRDIEDSVRKMFGWFPVVSITGPRQSGKSTLIRHMFRDYEYLNLEDVDLRSQALRDPVGFINSRPNRLIIDEAQLAPELFSQIQVRSDEADVPGQYILSGSQNFVLLKSIKQSLAGRVGILNLLPLSFNELSVFDSSISPDEAMFKGGYPRSYKMNIDPSAYFESYINTFLLRDITGLVKEVNIETFKRFVKICAHYAGNLVNVSNLGRQAEISRSTATEWLNLLKSGYVVFQLQPYFNNAIKSLTKTPKIYFYDTGLLVYLLGIRSLGQLLTSQHLEKVYENYIISETIKKYRNRNTEPNLYYYRDNNGLEVDLLDMTDVDNVSLTEIKSGETFREEFIRGVNRLDTILPINVANKQVVMRVKNSYSVGEVQVLTTQDYLTT